MNGTEDADQNTSLPGSPPDLTGSKSSKTSSYHSSYDENCILEDVGHFEDIGLEDDSRAEAEIGVFPSKTSNPYGASYASDLRSTPKTRNRVPMSNTQGNRAQRELTRNPSRPAYPTLRGQIRSATTDGLGLVPVHTSTLPGRGLMSPTPGSPSFPMKRNRSSSPRHTNGLKHQLSTTSLKPKRSTSVSTASRERKTAKQLELECDEDDGDDVPDECFLENVPISPRPAYERAASRPVSTANSPERPEKKTKPLGNGTGSKPAEQGELRSPKPSTQRATTISPGPGSFPKARAKSWTAAMSELSPEAKALTEALEEHAEEREKMTPEERRSLGSETPRGKLRVKSSMAELPPLRRTDIMIDPLPISKEKEAVLSRTRPSWLPPKDPSEEKRHLKEYQRMMTQSEAADRKKAAGQQQKSTCRDDAASSLLKIWEAHVLPNFDEVRNQKRTRDLWWKGVAPRSRGAVWAKAIGNELGLSDTSYTAALRRSQSLEKTIKKGSQLSSEEERKKCWLDQIESDVKSTYPELKIFQPEGPLHESLIDVLKAYAMYRSDVGYVHGTSTIAALLLLNLPTPSSTFIALSNILNRPLPLSFHTSDASGTSRTYALFTSTLTHQSPRLAAHLSSLSLSPDVFAHSLFASLLTSCLSLDNMARLWDVMVFEGDAIVVRASVAYLVCLEGKLFGCQSGEEVRGVLKEGVECEEEEWMNSVRAAGREVGT